MLITRESVSDVNEIILLLPVDERRLITTESLSEGNDITLLPVDKRRHPTKEGEFILVVCLLEIRRRGEASSSTESSPEACSRWTFLRVSGDNP